MIDFFTDAGVPVTVAIVGVLGSIFVAALSFALGRRADAAARRREAYAGAQRALVAYVEYPWRIRRRTSDHPDELRRLAGIGHELQQDLAYHQTWIESESRWVGEIFRQVRGALASEVIPAAGDAWTSEPILTASGMVLGDWGPNAVDAHLRRFDKAVGFRFGWRRVIAVLRWHPRA